MLKPTPAEFRTDTRIDWVALGFPETTAGDALLESEIDLAWAYVNAKTCQDLTALAEGSDKAILARQAIKLRTVQASIQGSSSYLQGTLTTLIQSFSVPGYSETRFDPRERRSDAKFSPSYVNDWPVLADLLWQLMDEACRQSYLDEIATGEGAGNPPASVITHMGWNNSLDKTRYW